MPVFNSKQKPCYGYVSLHICLKGVPIKNSRKTYFRPWYCTLLVFSLSSIISLHRLHLVNRRSDPPSSDPYFREKSSPSVVIFKLFKLEFRASRRFNSIGCSSWRRFTANTRNYVQRHVMQQRLMELCFLFVSILLDIIPLWCEYSKERFVLRTAPSHISIPPIYNGTMAIAR